jgi:lipopolysaccharide biosynthesis glycosyltransferase
MENIRHNSEIQSLNNLNKSFCTKNIESIYYKNYKFYRYLTFSLIIINIPIYIALIKISKKTLLQKIESSIELRYNYVNRRMISFIEQQKLKIKQYKAFNASENNSPKLPEYKEEHLIKKPYDKISYDKTNIIYNFEDLFNKRNLFLIDYSDYSYQKMDKSLSFDDNAEKIFNTTGMLNITKLEFYYYNQNLNTENLNHIHLSMAFDKNYILLSSISIVSILNTSSSDTFINFHIILNDCSYEDIKPIIKLGKINQQTSFIFYNGKQAEYDFSRGFKEKRGIGEYSRLLIPEIVNNTNKILILDSGDILAIRDLSQIFYFELGNYYFAFSIEDVAGRFAIENIFSRYNFYPNGGVTLVNVRKFREDKLYKQAFLASISYENIPCPFQEILFMISNYKFKIFPLNFNCPQFYKSKEQFIKNNFTSEEINIWIEGQNLTPFKYSKKELVNAALNPVILHLYRNKPFYNLANEENTEKWINYSKMTNLFERIKKEYAKPFKNRNK